MQKSGQETEYREGEKLVENRSIWREWFAFLKLVSVGNRSVVPVMLLGGMAGAVRPFLGLYYSARILNEIIEGEYDACMISVVFLLGTQFIAGVIEWASGQSISVLQESCSKSLNQRVAAKGFELEYEQYEKQETMDAIRRTRHSAMGTGGIEYQVWICYQMFREVFSLVCSVFYVVLLFLQVDQEKGGFFTSYASTLALLVCYGLILCVSSALGRRVSGIVLEMDRKNDRFNSGYFYINRLIMDEKNGMDLRINQMSEVLAEQSLRFVDKEGIEIFLNTGKKRGRLLGVNSFMMQIGAGLSYAFVGAKAYYGVIGAGDVLLYAGAITRLMESFTSFVNDCQTFLRLAAVFKNFEEFISRPSMSYDGTLPIEKRDDGLYEFEFHDVSFSYPGREEEVLSHVSLKFTVGEKLAVVGRNGAGKTTLVKLLCRLYEPTDGFITLNGIDIWKYNYKEYTQIFSVVFQDFSVFSLPLDENIAASGDTDEELVWKVLEDVDLMERVRSMENGIHSHLYNNNGSGIDISGGEAQRLAIARALYKDAPFVILDEPTAALDPIAEAEIYRNFNKMVEKKTAIYISHRMSSCRFCDHIVVLDHGKIAETGSHEQLLQKQGIYAELYETQAQYYA